MEVDVDGLDADLLNELFEALEQRIPDGQNPDSSPRRLRDGSYQKEGQEPLQLRQPKCTSEHAIQGGPGCVNLSKRQRDAEKVKELEAVAAAKAQQLAALLQRNQELKFKSKILTDAVTLRDDQLRIVKGWRASLTERASLTAWPLPSPSESVVAGTAAAGQTDATAMQLQQLRSTAQVVHAPGSARLIRVPEMMTAAERDYVRGIGRKELAARWRAFVSEASVLLLKLELNPGDETSACRMMRLAVDICTLCRRVQMIAPQTMIATTQTHLETGELVAPEPGFWTGVLPYLQLTDEQLRDLRAVYELFSGMMSSVLAERRTIQAQLSAGMQRQPSLVAGMQVPPEAEVLPSLERNMRKEGAAHLLVRGFLYGRTFSVVQLCRAAVHAHPYFPSATGLAAAAAGVIV